MAIQLSPGVNVTEIDLTTIVPAVSTSVGAFSGLFRWGPVGERVLLDTETSLVNRFGKPTNYNSETWFTAANFLSYTNALYISRAANTGGAVASQSFIANTVGGTVSNNHYFVVSGNTDGIVADMYVTQSSNTSTVMTDVTVLQVINSSCVVLSSNTNSVLATTLYFGWPETSYTALGVESGTFVSNLVNQIVTNENSYTSKEGNFEDGVTWIAKYPGSIGNSIRVAVVDNAETYSSNISLSNNSISGTMYSNVGSNVAILIFNGDTSGNFAANVVNHMILGDQILFGNSSINLQYMKITDISNITTNSTSSGFNLQFQTPYRLHTNY